jgi:putative nucleotidyltransferase with HDIG domain
MVEERTVSLRKVIEGIIRAMSLTVESRDPYTSGHQHRVAMLSAAIAAEMGLSQGQIEAIRLAAMIHDLGKIAVPAEVLSKPTRLSDIEFALIKTHPQIGYDILKEIEFPWPIARMVHQHHEKIDGSGYPQGLSGEDILLEARILCVADVVEAMASHRPYRPAIGLNKALEEISDDAGRLYDTEAVKTCLRLFRQKGFSFS